ncbi:hypothetical protein BC829DRAFT_395254 [Chytridium lagenaria]|nr:hypothetical protein BC829DRAFT_395254 [Chytridium lagenaria]
MHPSPPPSSSFTFHKNPADISTINLNSESFLEQNVTTGDDHLIIKTTQEVDSGALIASSSSTLHANLRMSPDQIDVDVEFTDHHDPFSASLSDLNTRNRSPSHYFQIPPLLITTLLHTHCLFKKQHHHTLSHHDPRRRSPLGLLSLQRRLPRRPSRQRRPQRPNQSLYQPPRLSTPCTTHGPAPTTRQPQQG